MSQQDSTPPFKSSLPELKLPPGGFSSSIPEHLLKDADPQTAWLMHEISKNTAATEFACRAAVTHNDHLRTLNGRTSKSEEGIKAVKADIEVLTDKAKTMEPLFKPISQFMNLWEYRWFRWICYAALLLFFSYLLPYYIQHPISIDTLFKLFGGG